MKKLNIKLIAIIAVVLLILVSVIIYNLFGKKGLSDLEKIRVVEISNDVIKYTSDIDAEKTDLDKLILYVMEYNYNENNDDVMTIYEVRDAINNTFNRKVSEIDVDKVGVSPLMLDAGISVDINTGEYRINYSKLSMKDIANKEVEFYKNTKTYKKGKKYYSEAEKYVIKNPYDVLNYYNDLNNSADLNSKKKTKKVNLDKLNAYLEGKATVKEFREYVNDDVLKKYGKTSGIVEVELITSDDKILVNKIYKK